EKYTNEYKLSIFNLFGQKINEIIVNDNYAEWRPNDLAKGIYIYELVSAGKRLGAGKIILQ
nr:T9SS type A sorting domain-containing protein [Chitinophagales bacterium]MBP9222191.1 T9SS type A sorting domain-containing protein [Chitinophagales bacterium]